MSRQDIAHHYEHHPDESGLIEADIDKRRCKFDLSECPCEDCGLDNKDEDVFFWSDGGYEPRDGTYLCRKCSRKLFAV